MTVETFLRNFLLIMCFWSGDYLAVPSKVTLIREVEEVITIQYGSTADAVMFQRNFSPLTCPPDVVQNDTVTIRFSNSLLKYEK